MDYGAPFRDFDSRVAWFWRPAMTRRYFGKMMSVKGIATVVVPHFVK